MATVKDVPAAKVGEVVQSFIDDDEAVQVTCKQTPGTNPPTWTVTAKTN